MKKPGAVGGERKERLRSSFHLLWRFFGRSLGCDLETHVVSLPRAGTRVARLNGRRLGQSVWI